MCSKIKGVMIGVMALALCFALSTPALPQGSCNTSLIVTPIPDAAPVLVEDEYTVRMRFGVLEVVAGTSATRGVMQFQLDCVGPLAEPPVCVDETNKIYYMGDSSITTTGACGASSFSSDNPGGGYANTLNFTATPALTLLVGETCDLMFRVRVDEKSGDATPNLIEHVGSDSSTCDNALTDSNSKSAQIGVNDCVVQLDKCVALDGDVCVGGTCTVTGLPCEIDFDCCVGIGVEDGTSVGVSVDKQPVEHRIIVSNPGLAEEGFMVVGNCTVLDPKLGVALLISSIDPGGVHVITSAGFCDETREGTNEATVTCDQCGERTAVGPYEDSDTVDLECQTPIVTLTKVCERTDGDTFDYVIEVEDTGDTELSCMLYDSAEPGTCPGVPVPGTLPADWDLGPELLLPGGSIWVVTFGPNFLPVGSCNTAWVVCEVINPLTGAPEPDSCVRGECVFNGGECTVDADCGIKTLTEVANNPCTPEGEFTKTPGFWCTHPEVIDFFNLLPITVCGVELTRTEADCECSTSEALSIAIEGDIELQLARQCTAAALNCAAGGACFVEYDFCCTDCDSVPMLDGDGENCIEALDMFNNSGDEVEAPFDGMFSANPGECRAAKKTMMTIFGLRDNGKGPDKGPKGPKGPK